MNCCNQLCNQGRNCPNRKSAMQTTRKHPRTLQEAFGPYTGHEFEDDKPTSYGALWWSVIVIVSVIGGYLIATGVPA